MNNIDALPRTAHDTADDRPVDMIDSVTLRDYMRQIRRRYMIARREGRTTYAADLAATFTEIRTELRTRNFI